MKSRIKDAGRRAQVQLSPARNKEKTTHLKPFLEDVRPDTAHYWTHVQRQNVKIPSQCQLLAKLFSSSWRFVPQNRADQKDQALRNGKPEMHGRQVRQGQQIRHGEPRSNSRQVKLIQRVFLVDVDGMATVMVTVRHRHGSSTETHTLGTVSRHATLHHGHKVNISTVSMCFASKALHQRHCQGHQAEHRLPAGRWLLGHWHRRRPVCE